MTIISLTRINYEHTDPLIRVEYKNFWGKVKFRDAIRNDLNYWEWCDNRDILFFNDLFNHFIESKKEKYILNK